MAESDQKSYFDVLGLCCSSEVSLIEDILKPLEGVKEVNVIVASRTVIVVHDNGVISENQIVKALNKARLEANVRVYGKEKHGNTWPSPYTMVCGFLLLVSLFKFIFDPLKWVAIGAVVIGLVPIIFKSIATIQNSRLPINILVLIAVGGTIAVGDYIESGTIVFLFSIAAWLESRASHKATAVMSSLMNMVPQKAILAETGQVIDAKDVKLSMILAVKTGEVIPIDGVVVEGNCDVDEKTLTGNPSQFLNKISLIPGSNIDRASSSPGRITHPSSKTLGVPILGCFATTGVLIKGGDYLEILAKTKIVAFDKTGTITSGEFSITDFKQLSSDVSFNTLLFWVSSLESKSSHPMAAALVEYGQLNSLKPNPESVQEFQNFPGEGIYGEIDGKQIYVGSKRIAIRAGCGTGDTSAAALRVNDQINHAIDVVHAELLPEEKVKIIKELQKEGHTVMIGDGVNDAPALATADIGISMGISGSALATETGDITLMSNDIRKIPQAIRLARRTRWKIIQNVGLSVSIKAAILALAFAGHPLVWAAVLADVGTCVVVILNSMLLLRGTNQDQNRHKKYTCVSPHAHSQGNKSHNGCGHSHAKSGLESNNIRKASCCSREDVPNGCGDKKGHVHKEDISKNHHHDHHSHGSHSCNGSYHEDVPNGCENNTHSHGNSSQNGCGHSHAKSGLESNNIRKASCCSREDVPNGCGDKKGHVQKEEISKNHHHDHHNHSSHSCNGSYHEDVPNGRNNTHSHGNSSQNGCGHSHPKCGLESNNIRKASCCSREDVPNGCEDKKGHVHKEEISKNHH
ncbi:hypothetical protein GIB67_027958 [Kingdonia uniflora]|uniref:HMA domain-containing protein n=1 Tax=Kingdonia uniflora TaxID=39325 RepID=A0A7J7LGW7_9MAGN|nr:hypothetical protein GIB67_027958 [Kingdonia uniflora]